MKVAHSKITDDDLVKIIEARSRQSLNIEGEDLSSRRVKAMKMYRGDLQGDEEPGRSSYRSREVFETIEWIIPSLMRLFFSSARPVEFLPRTIEDVEAAKQETDSVGYWFFERNNGFLLTHDYFKSALMYPNAYMKVYHDERIDVEEVTYTGLNAEAIAMLAEEANGNDDIQVVDWAEAGVAEVLVPDPEAGLVKRQAPLYDVKVRRTSRERRVKCEGVPPEELLVDNGWHSLDLDDCPFVAHRRIVTRSDLIERGFDEKDLELIPAGEVLAVVDPVAQGSEQAARYDSSDEEPFTTYDPLKMDESMARYRVTEAYLKVDVDGDGIAERRRVTVIGNQVMENEVHADMPFVALATILMPARHVGMSLAEAVMDLQKLSTVLHRQMLNSVYAINTRRTFVSKQAMTADGKTAELMANPAARFIPVEGAPQEAVFPDPTQSVMGDLLPLINQVDQRRKIRSGVSPETSLDPEILKETTAHAYLGAQEAASQRIELIARVFAETGMKKIFLKIHQLLRRHFDQELAVELRGKWVQVNPSNWSKRTDMRVCVGLGYNGSMQTVSALGQIFAMQKELESTGISNPGRLYNTLEKLVEAMNVGHAPEFFIQPGSPEFKPPPPKPDPAMIMAQAAMAEAQNKLQASMIKTQADSQKAMLDAQIQREGKDVDLALREAELRLKQLEVSAQTYDTSHKAAVEYQREKANVAQAQAQSALMLAQAGYNHAMAHKTAQEAQVSARKLESEITLNEARAESEEQKAVTVEKAIVK